MHPLEQEVQYVTEQCRMGNITQDERNYLLTEIRDIKVAQECANDEMTFRIIVQACNVAMSL